MSEFTTVRYETPAPGVARIVMAREAQRNAQNKRMTYELNACFDRAAHDDEIKVIIFAADGPHFSSGHDLRDGEKITDFSPMTNWGGFSKPGAEGRQAGEEEIYFGMCWRWRNLPKPTIAEVQGKVIAGGLMLVWVCDIIYAADDATFSDPVVAFGVNGVEYFGHPWEFGVRKAKEMLFTGGIMTAQEAQQLGMVNRVIPRAELQSYTLSVAKRIAERPSMGLRLAKQSVNQAQDAQGFWTALQAAMSLQQLGHSHNAEVYKITVHPEGAEVIRREAKATTAGGGGT